jgi:hypothetical protein
MAAQGRGGRGRFLPYNSHVKKGRSSDGQPRLISTPAVDCTSHLVFMLEAGFPTIFSLMCTVIFAPGEDKLSQRLIPGDTPMYTFVNSHLEKLHTLNADYGNNRF